MLTPRGLRRLLSLVVTMMLLVTGALEFFGPQVDRAADRLLGTVGDTVHSDTTLDHHPGIGR